MQLTPYQLRVLTHTVLGEANPRDAAGQAAVASVILNRAASGQFPSDPAAVALQHNQFSAWNDLAHGGNNNVRIPTSDPQYIAAEKIVEQVADGAIPDPTGGATYYYAPNAMANGSVPSWASGMYQTANIGGQLFFSPHPVPPASIPSNADPISAGPLNNPALMLPLPAPTPLTAPKIDPIQQPLPLPSFDQFQAQLGLNTTPLPVPRPATPLQAPPVPMPMPTPSWLQPTASQPASTAQHLVNLNGKMVPVGTYPSPSNPGSTVTVSDDGTGKAVVKNNDPGLAGGIGPGTVAGSIIGQKIGQAADAAKAGAATALGNAGNTLNGAKDQIGALGSNIVSGAGSLLSGLFGNKPPNVPSPPASYLGAANSNGAKANGTDSFTPALGSSTSGALGNATGAKANDTDGFAPVTTTVRNPAYDAWFAQYGNQGGLATGTSENTVSAKFNDTDGSAPPVAPKPVPLAPPKYITKTVQGNSSGGGQQQSSPPPQTFSGSSTGRTYTVGQTYSNNNGTYVAQANGTFARVGSAQSTPSAHQASGSQPSPALAMNGQPIRATGGY